MNNLGSRIFIRVQAENKKNTPGTFRNQLDPRIDLAPFFLPPGTVFAYHPGHLCGPLWPPLALPPLWTGLLTSQISPFPVEFFYDFRTQGRAYAHVFTEVVGFQIACIEKKLWPFEDTPFFPIFSAHTWGEPFGMIA